LKITPKKLKIFGAKEKRENKPITGQHKVLECGWFFSDRVISSTYLAAKKFNGADNFYTIFDSIKIPKRKIGERRLPAPIFQVSPCGGSPDGYRTHPPGEAKISPGDHIAVGV